MHSRKRLLAGIAVLALSAFAAPAVAQEQSTSGTEADAAAGDIIVTANRTESLASKTPIALSAISQEGLRDSGVTNPLNLSDVVPNLSIDRAFVGIQVTIRGITSTDTTEKGDPSVAFLQDGIYIARPQAQEVSFFDLERVEVLRGPQGTLYGRNTTAGVINVISAKPKHQFEASLDGAYGNFNTVQATGMVNLPVGNSIALRGAVNLERRDNYIRKGVASPFSISPFKDNLSGRLSALIDISPSINLLVRGDYSRMDGTGFSSVRLANFFAGPFVPGQRPRYVDLGSKARRTLAYAPVVDTSSDNETWGIMGELNWDMGPVTMTYLGSYRELTQHDDLQTDLGAPVTFPVRFDGAYWQNSQELRFAYNDGGSLTAQAGGYYFKERSGIAAFFLNPPFIPGALAFGFPQDPTIAESKGVFGQATYELAPGFKLTAGIRYSHDLKSRMGQTVIIFPAPIGTIPTQQNDARRNFEKVTWRLGADYDFGKTLVYAVVSTGYKAGGFNDGCEIGKGPFCAFTADVLYYDPETVTAYEAGIKTRFADDAVRLTAALFHYDYKGLQLSSTSNVCGGPCQVTTNAGAAKIDGLELEAVVKPNENHRIDLGFNYLDARYARFIPTPGIDFAGRPLDRSPKISASAGYAYTYPFDNGGKVEAGARVRLSDSYTLTDFTAVVQFRQPSFHKTDLTLTYSAPNDRFYLQGYVKNLEDKITLGSASANFAGTAVFADPRTYGVRAGFKF